ncbi:uncharacterized protein EV422DRAFT_505609 [Fimicolochytrium jonesii]|uniref:uncharacterized protein n=1 Tax=Fimicolochytrium jonesii TaxID=1396493 RepID=UPI0022FE6F73|nr:uncharacterized protein EV422DRAFT_505609 [Fimicolochytrium jonesii]KAI8822108.1 hypothetical protein EV422DRAFT_505609 [Fimicolochytrium jonesii]
MPPQQPQAQAQAPLVQQSPYSLHLGVVCDACKADPLPGVFRLKCGNCPDFDLCDQCFSHKTPQTHPPDHTFLVLTRPLPNPPNPKSAQPLLSCLLDYATWPQPATQPRVASVNLLETLGLSTPDRYLIIIDDLLSDAQCTDLVAYAESLHFSSPPANKFGVFVSNILIRSDSSVMTGDIHKITWLWNEISPYVPPQLPGGATGDALQVRGLNPQLRFNKYTPSQSFAAHADAPFTIHRLDGTLQSKLTLMIYLGTDNMTGGATRFLNAETMKHFDVEPRKGRALIFSQDLVHAGLVVKEGIKYAVRADIMYFEKPRTAWPEQHHGGDRASLARRGFD